MSEKGKFLDAEKFNRLAEQGKNGLHAAYKEGKEKKTRKDLIAALAGGIQKMLEEGMRISDIVNALQQTEIANEMSAGTMRVYIMQLCGKKARKKKVKKVKPATAPATTTGVTV